MIVLDTDVLSELTRERPSQQVLHWHRAQEDLFTTAISEAEMFYGLELMPRGRRRREMWTSLDRIFNDVFAARILPFDCMAALMYADLAASRKRIGDQAARCSDCGDRTIARGGRSHKERRRFRALRHPDHRSMDRLSQTG